MSMKESYDVVVVGGGPAGSMAAFAAAKEGVSVLLLEKDREFGVPVRCAEVVGKSGIENILEGKIEKRWIASEITKFQFVAPDGTEIFPQVNQSGYVLHRKFFDYDLAMRAASAGAQLVTKAYVQNLLFENGKVSGVVCNIKNTIFKIKAKIVIGADGVESRVGRWAGLKTTTKMRDMETCSQVTLANLPIDNNRCIFYFSQERTPGGYTWLFPKGDGTANVGLGIAGNKARYKSADQRLNEFLEEFFPGKPILNKTIGGVPCADRIERISIDGLLLAGDAALQGNPVTGGGITTGMVGGKIAGKIAAEAIKKRLTSNRYLKKYETEWDKAAGNAQRRYYRIKEGIKKLSDKQLNATAQRVKKIPPENQTLTKIFQSALLNQPSLLVDIIKVFSPFS